MKTKQNNSSLKSLKSSFQSHPTNYISSHVLPIASFNQNQFHNNEAPSENEFNIQYFMGKYLMKGQGLDNLKAEMNMVLKSKKKQAENLRIYKDQLKLISLKDTPSQMGKISMETLKQKAEVQQKLLQMKQIFTCEIKQATKQLQNLKQYQNFILNELDHDAQNVSDIIDISRQEQVMFKNLQTETQHLIRELVDEQKRNSRQVKAIQQQILQYRIMIKDKQDYLSSLKAKICTLHIKLHSHNNSRSQSKNKSMSLSVRKFNLQNYNDIKQAYMGNKTFKSFSKEIIEKISPNEELSKVRFYYTPLSKQQNGFNGRQVFYFQCFYKGKQGQIHKNVSINQQNEQDVTKDKISQTNQLFEEVNIKYMSSIKFFYKSRIVGVECRVKTDKGNKNIQVGNCDPHIQHELLTLVNKKVITLASYWHGKEMIGASVWYIDQKGGTQTKNKQKMVQQQYYS